MYNYQDSSGTYTAAIYFVSYVLVCSILFMNIIVAVLFDNYDDSEEEKKDEDLLELEEKAIDLGIPESVRDIIIRNDIIIDAKNRTSKFEMLKIYSKSLVSWNEEIKYPKTKYFQNKFIKFMHKLVNHPSFTLFIFIVIGLNTITLCLDIYTAGSGEVQIDFLEYVNLIFFAIFFLELTIKVIGLGLKEFVKDKFNLFDAFIVAISLVEIILASGSGAFTSLRAFRLFRIFKLFRVGGLRVMVDCITKTLKAISPFVICLGLLIYIFTLMGMQFFAGGMKFDENDLPDENGTSPRYNFDNFYESFLSVFIILTGENWNEMMYNAMRTTNPIASAYFVIVIVTGTVIMLQLLVAIMLNNFDYSHKLAEKRLIIDAIEKKMHLGKTVKESIQLILGKVFDIDEDGDNVNVNVKFGKNSISIKRKQTIASPRGFESFKIKSQSYPATRKNSEEASVRKNGGIVRPLTFKSRTDVYFLEEESKEDNNLMVELRPKVSKNLKNNDFSNMLNSSPSKDNFLNKGSENEMPNIYTNELSKFGCMKDQASDMSAHLNYELISEKLDSIVPSGLGATITKATTKNLKTIIQENIDEEDSSEEEKKAQGKAPESQSAMAKVLSESEERYQKEINEFQSESMIDSDEAKPIVVNKVWNYMKNSSLFLLHKDSVIRESLLNLVTTPEDIVRREKAEINPESYGIKDIAVSQALKNIDINEGKLLMSRKRKNVAKIFEYFIVVNIMLSCILLCIDTPLNNPDTVLSRTLAILDIIFSIVFL